LHSLQQQEMCKCDTEFFVNSFEKLAFHLLKKLLLIHFIHSLEISMIGWQTFSLQIKNWKWISIKLVIIIY